MIASLEYSANEGGPFKAVGVLRTRDAKFYRVAGVFLEDRAGGTTLAGTRSIITSRSVTIETDFLDSAEYYFQIAYREEPAIIFQLGLRSYTLGFDSLADRNRVLGYIVELNYITPLEALPVLPPPDLGGNTLTRLASYGGPGRAYDIHQAAAIQQIDSEEIVSFNKRIFSPLFR